MLLLWDHQPPAPCPTCNVVACCTTTTTTTKIIQFVCCASMYICVWTFGWLLYNQVNKDDGDHLYHLCERAKPAIAITTPITKHYFPFVVPLHSFKNQSRAARTSLQKNKKSSTLSTPSSQRTPSVAVERKYCRLSSSSSSSQTQNELSFYLSICLYSIVKKSQNRKLFAKNIQTQTIQIK